VIGARGEATIRLEDREVRVLYTNRALASAERMMGKSIIQVSQGFVGGESGISDIAYILLAGMQAAKVDARLSGRQYSLDDAYEVLDEVGFAGVAGPVMEAVADVLSYAADDGSADPNE
jgi:hypothetical protein